MSGRLSWMYLLSFYWLLDEGRAKQNRPAVPHSVREPKGATTLGSTMFFPDKKKARHRGHAFTSYLTSKTSLSSFLLCARSFNVPR